MQTMPWWHQLPAVRDGRVALVDGDAWFNRPGPRLVDALEWLAATILETPELTPRECPVVWLSREELALPASTPTANDATAAADLELADIEEAHRCAVMQGRKSYIDPFTGYSVFTQLAALERGKCCGSGCRHCPYEHERVPERRRRNLKPPIVFKQAQS